MTTIAAIRDESGIYIAGDGRASAGSDILSETYPKIFRLGRDSGVLAISGSAFFCNLIKTTEGAAASPESLGQMLVEILKGSGFKPREHDGHVPNYGFSALMAHRGILWEIGCDGATIRKELGEFAAVGTGCQYAIGSMASTSPTMDPLDRCELAVEIAARFDAGTGAVWSACSIRPSGVEGVHLEDSPLRIGDPEDPAH